MRVKPSPRATIRAIMVEEAAKAGIGVGEILGAERTRKVAAARHAAIRRVRAAYPGKSTLVIGRIFRRHHTTILYACGRLKSGRQDAAKKDSHEDTKIPRSDPQRAAVTEADAPFVSSYLRVNPPSSRPWTPAMTAFLVRMRRRGKTFGWIANALGVTRGVAVGRAAKRGLALKPALKARVIQAVRGDEPAAIGPRRELVDEGRCRWIKGDVGDRDWRMCGHPSVHGSSWCAHHRARVWKAREATAHGP
jgi:hypothetical protein